MELQGEADDFTILLGDFNTPLAEMERGQFK